MEDEEVQISAEAMDMASLAFEVSLLEEATHNFGGFAEAALLEARTGYEEVHSISLITLYCTVLYCDEGLLHYDEGLPNSTILYYADHNFGGFAEAARLDLRGGALLLLNYTLLTLLYYDEGLPNFTILYYATRRRDGLRGGALGSFY